MQGILNTFQNWKVCHTKRGANSAAHMLAKEGLNLDTDQILVDCIPACVRKIVLSEIHTLDI
jgi:hypothetical protein